MAVPKNKKPRRPKTSSRVSRSSTSADLLASGSSRSSVNAGPSASASHKVEPNTAFFLFHHPANWRIAVEGLDAPAWVPDIQKKPLTPGCNGIRTRRANEPEEATYVAAIDEDQRDGAVYLWPESVIPDHCLPDGITGEGYLRVYPCRGNMTGRAGEYFCEVWDLPVASLPNEAQQYKFDRASYNRWLVWLVESGTIEPPIPRIVDRLVQRVEDHLARAKVLNVAPDLRAERIAQRSAELERSKTAQAPEVAA